MLPVLVADRTALKEEWVTPQLARRQARQQVLRQEGQEGGETGASPLGVASLRMLRMLANSPTFMTAWKTKYRILCGGGTDGKRPTSSLTASTPPAQDGPKLWPYFTVLLPLG